MQDPPGTRSSQLPPRKRSLPVAPHAPPSKRPLTLDGAVRDVDRRHRPNYAVWEITLACDLACRHCGSRAGRARPDELDTKEALDLVDQMADLGVKEVSLIGGEAYLREDWLQIVRHVRDRGMLCQITTGARGLTKDVLLAARDAGLQSVSISVDGFEQTHDSLRGLPGSFAAVKRTLADMRTIGDMRVTANTQVNRLSLREIEPLYAWLIEEGIKAWQVQLTAAMGRAADDEGILLEPYQVLETHPMLVRAMQYGNSRGVRMWPGNNIGYFGPFEHLLRGDWRQTHRGSCGAGRSTLGIEANGDIKGCPSLSTAEFVGGNIRDHKLLDIWERSQALRFTRDITKASLGGYCAECYYAEDCYGGCHWTASVLTGRIGDNPYCHHRAVELLARGERERIELETPAPGLPFDHAVYKIVRERWPSEALLQKAREITASGEGFLDDPASPAKLKTHYAHFGGSGVVRVWNALGDAEAPPFTAALRCELSPFGRVGKHVQRDHDELVVGLSGEGRALVNGTPHALSRDCVVHLPLGATLEIENLGASALSYVIVKANAATAPRNSP